MVHTPLQHAAPPVQNPNASTLHWPADGPLGQQMVPDGQVERFS